MIDFFLSVIEFSKIEMVAIIMPGFYFLGVECLHVKCILFILLLFQFSYLLINGGLFNFIHMTLLQFSGTIFISLKIFWQLSKHKSYRTRVLDQLKEHCIVWWCT